jgi:2'-5' RNA ligase
MKKIIWKNYFDVVIIPPKEISDYAIGLSKKLSQYGTKWILGRKSFIPHISLYHIAVKPKDFQAFVAEVKNTVKNFSLGYLNTTMIGEDSLMFNEPTWIKKLYLKIILKTVKYFDWDYGTKNLWRFPNGKNKSEAGYIKKYGTPLFGKSFSPHVTIARYADNPPKIKNMKAKKFKFKPDHVYICELGSSHSCQRIVEKIPF